MRRVHTYISGRVQGVFFRATTHRAAIGFHITGWVRNMPDGRVEALFEGNNEDVDKMLKWCHVGPPAARVDKVITEEETFIGEYTDFQIKHP